MLLSTRGFTVVSMTRALVQMSRLARALRPRAILLDFHSEGVNDVVRDLRSAKDLDEVPILVFARDGSTEVPTGDMLVEAADADLVHFVERQR
jgi:DNA-binding response OmpR family regulator